ncbi:MAG: trigger factor [Clostridia bacterium]|nr:trigger factor [Clostridia bacterium]
MSVKVEKTEKNIVNLEFEVSAEAFEAAMQKAYIKNVKSFNIPGFRKGKAPRKIIEKMYSPAVFYDDAINFVFPEAYENAIQEAGVEPVDRPEVDIKQFPEEGKNLILTAKVTVKPEVTLGKIDKITVEAPSYPVAKKDVDAEIERMRAQNARIVPVEDRASQLGDTVVIDYEGFCDGVAFDGGKAEGHSLELGSGQFIPGFEDQLVGKKPEEDVEVKVTFPKEYHAENLAGKDATFKVKVHEIKAKELPELDDEFAKDVSEFETLKELRDDINKKLKDSAAQREKQELENNAIDFVISKMKAEIPEVMYENRIDDMVRDFDMRLSYQGMNVEKYLQFSGMDMAAFRAQFKDQAVKQVQGMLALEAVAKKQKIEATDADVDAEYAKLAEQYKMEVDQIKTYILADDLKKDVVTNKTIEYLLSIVEAKPAAKKTATKKTAAKADAEEKPAAKKTTTKKTTTKKADGEEKPAAKKTTTKKTTTKKAAEKAE